MHRDDEHEVDVVVVGAGPGGAVLGYLLARSGVETHLLERHSDLDREFRGFGFQPDALRLFDEMDLLDPILDLDHREVRVGEVSVYDRSYEVFDFDDIPGPYDFALLMEQPPLLEVIIEACSLLHIEPGLAETWTQDGVLLLGDAAHVASPIGAQGNALAIQDAVVAHAVVAEALDRGDGPLSAGTLRRYEQRRRSAVERVLRGQRFAERGLSALVRRDDALPESIKRPLLRGLFALPARIPIARLPFGRRLLTRALFGPEPVHVDRTRFRD